ncbi:hypothetical protein BB561_002253 [Smittium simulii]|uniref:[histone H3]-trimethyl-L-lysine(4) demethylase n=1 Tax=Smittium simulii TaxID=133385 RepID=A0A2T9YR24_9FUNG|nr:hypothetical protein BB561_002253 [Smittium simulii]
MSSNNSSHPLNKTDFDLSSVILPQKYRIDPLETSSYTSDSKGPKTNFFNLKQAKTYFPSKAEFTDPFSFIENIRLEAEKYGIIKIVPPEDWCPNFAINTKNFRFHTRLQQLNALEGKNRIKKNYVDQVLNFFEKTDQKIYKIPHLDKKPIDIYKLKNEVNQRGGYDQVNKKKMWAEIGRFLGYDRKSCTSLSNTLKTTFFKIIKPYEDYLIDSTSLQSYSSQNAQISADSSDTCTNNLFSHPSNNQKNNKKLDSNSESSDSDSEADKFWLDYGFEEGSSYSLSEFQQKSNSFKMKFFASYFNSSDGFKSNSVPPEVIEKFFWSTVSNPNIDIGVEYGADLASSIHGSGFPTNERNPLDPYSNDNWNLNNIPHSTKSLFSYFKENVDGMTIPWLYVGMCLSTFCWHNEDHYTYSINYMHWGEAKTWYGVSGDQSELFESTMKKAFPELFESNPSVLYHLVTIISPKILKDNGVEVYTIDQNPGEFVITFPQAYHSGFNQGFNFNEAVNFATSDWVPFGKKSIQIYQNHKRLPVFCHEELLCSINKHYLDLNFPRPIWLTDSLNDIIQDELKHRNTFRSLMISKYKDLTIEEISADQITDVDSDDLLYLKYLSSNSAVNCKNCLKWCYFSFLHQKDEKDNNDLYCTECFNCLTESEISHPPNNIIRLVLAFNDSSLIKLNLNSSELSLKWIASVCELFLNKNDHDLTLSNRNNINGSKNYNRHTLKAILNDESKSVLDESSIGKFQISVLRSIINYASYLVDIENAQQFIKNNFNQLISFNKKVNNLCAIAQSLFKISNKLDTLNKCNELTFDSAVAVFDPAILIIMKKDLYKDTTLQKNSTKYSEKVINIFKSLNNTIGVDYTLLNTEFMGVLTADSKFKTQKILPSFNINNQENSFNNLEATVKTEVTPNTTTRSTRLKRSSSSFVNLKTININSATSSPEIYKNMNGTQKTSLDILKLNNIYNYVIDKSKSQLINTVIDFISKNEKILTEDKLKPPYSVDLIDSLIKEFKSFNVDCPEFIYLKEWQNRYQITAKKLENFLNLMSHYKLSETNCTYCLQDIKKCKYSLAVNIILDDSLTTQFDSLVKEARDTFLNFKNLDSLVLTRPKLLWALSVKKELKNRSLDMDKMIDLLDNAISLGICTNHPDFIYLKDLKVSIIKWDQEVISVLGLQKNSEMQPKSVLTLRKCATLLQRAHNLEFSPHFFNELKTVHSKILDLQASCDSMVEKATSTYFPSRPSLDEAQKMYLAIEDNEKNSGYIFSPSSASKLKQFILDVEKWLFEVKHTFLRSNVTRSIYDILVDVSQGTKKANEVIEQISSTIVLYNHKNNYEYLEKLYFDLSKTLFEQHSNCMTFNILKSLHPRNVLCVCGSTNSGTTIKCSNCPLVFHARCLKLSKKQIYSGLVIICPICNKDFSHSHFTKYPTISSIGKLIDKGRKLNLVCPELDLLLNIALDIRSIAHTLFKITGIISNIYNSQTSSRFLKDLAQLVCCSSILVKLSTEIDIDKDNIGSLQCNGEHIESTLRKYLSISSLGDKQLANIPKTAKTIKSIIPIVSSISMKSARNINKKQKIQHNKDPNTNTKKKVYDSSDSDDNISLNQNLLLQLNRHSQITPESQFDYSNKIFKKSNIIPKSNSNIQPYKEINSNNRINDFQGALKTTSNLIIDNNEICICQATKNSDKNWNNPNNYVICCDYCNEYFHLSCVLVNKEQAQTILYHQNLRKSYNDFKEPEAKLSSSHKLMAYMCPICSYSKRLDYQFGEIVLDAS